MPEEKTFFVGFHAYDFIDEVIWLFRVERLLMGELSGVRVLETVEFTKGKCYWSWINSVDSLGLKITADYWYII